MSFNQVENLFLADAISELEKKLKQIGELPPNKTLYLGMGYNFILLKDGRLTIKGKDGQPRQDITPVNCYNFYKRMPIAEAVEEYLDRQANPQNYSNPFFI